MTKRTKWKWKKRPPRSWIKPLLLQGGARPDLISRHVIHVVQQKGPI